MYAWLNYFIYRTTPMTWIKQIMILPMLAIVISLVLSTTYAMPVISTIPNDSSRKSYGIEV